MVIVVCVFGLGALRYSVKDFHELLIPEGRGTVISEPEQRDQGTRFVFHADNGEKVLVTTNMYSRVEYGDRVGIEGKLKRPGIIEEDGRSFDYAKFLSKDDIYYTMSFARVSVLEHDGGNRLYSLLYRIKNGVVSKMKEILPEPESSLLAGLIVAGKEALPSKVLTDFKNAGVVHVVVLSGYNVTIIIDFFLVLLVGLSLRKRMLVAGVGIVLFVLMTGANASIVRASIMAVAVLLGRVLHRPYSAPRALLLACALMLLWNPKLLVFDPSFQLSFLAMLALIYVTPIIGARIGFIPEKHGLRELVSVTSATQLTVLPYLLYSAGSVSVVSLLSNVLILAVVPYTMLVGSAATLVAFVSDVLAWPFAYVAHMLLAWILGVSHVLGSLSFAQIKVSHFPLWLTLVAYLIMGGLIWYNLRSSLRQTSS